MKRLILPMMLVVLAATCGEGPAADVPQVGETPPVGSGTTTTAEIEAPTTTTTPPTTTTTTTPPTTTTTTTPPTTTTTTTPPTDSASDPEIMTGTFYPTGTPIPIVLPEGAIGPSEVISGETGRLVDLIGVPTYRMRTTFSAPVLTGGEDTGEYVIETDVIEGADEDTITLHARWVSPNIFGEADPLFEVLLIDGRQYRRDQGDEWRDNTGGALFGWLAPPITYSMINGFSSLISASQWLGNEEIDGVPVGWYLPFEFEDSFSSSEPEISGSREFWIDADGVVWRAASEMFVEGQLWWAYDAVLFDVGADIVIEAPTVP